VFISNFSSKDYGWHRPFYTLDTGGLTVDRYLKIVTGHIKRRRWANFRFCQDRNFDFAEDFETQKFGVWGLE
jgi:hypothetical protein